MFSSTSRNPRFMAAGLPNRNSTRWRALSSPLSSRVSSWLQISMGAVSLPWMPQESTMSLRPPGPLTGSRQSTPVSHTLTRVPSGRSNAKGSSCHSWRRVRAKKSCWGIIRLTLLSGMLWPDYTQGGQA
ncbi:hypothetical protein D3C79_788550 [compost metagenome]